MPRGSHIIYPNALPDPNEDRPHPNPNRNPLEWVVSVENVRPISKGKLKKMRHKGKNPPGMKKR